MGIIVTAQLGVTPEKNDWLYQESKAATAAAATVVVVVVVVV